MNLQRCSGCGTRPPEKLVQVTWAWRRADTVRVAHRGRLCNACFAAKVAPLSIDYTGVETLTCPQCGIATEDDMDPIYTTDYVPGYGKVTTESPFCGACAATYRIWVLEHSAPVEDQFRAAGGPESHPGAEQILRELGLVDYRAQ